MDFFHQVRSLTRWSRALLVGLVIAFGLNTVAHAAHKHEPGAATSVAHAAACGYCVSFAGLAPAPNHHDVRLLLGLTGLQTAPACACPICECSPLAARPRGPPPL